MSAPRVLISGVVLAQPAGGVRRHNQELLPRIARRLETAGGALAVLVGPEGLPFELPRSVELIASNVPAGPPLARALRERRALREALARAAACGAPFDWVHVAHLPAPRGLAARCSITLHDLRSLAPSARPSARRLLARAVIGRAVRAAHVVIAVSETVRRELVERFELEPARVRVVPNAADHFEPVPRISGVDAPLLHVGHVEPRKNVELLLRALALDRSLPPLVCAGAPKGGEDRRLADVARSLGVDGRVAWLGGFDERLLPSLYARAGCVVLPSRIEGFGIAALEAQRARAPLAVARAGALLEVAGESTPSFAPDDAAGCARAIRAALAATPAELERARERADRFRWDDSADRWIEAWAAIE